MMVEKYPNHLDDNVMRLTNPTDLNCYFKIAGLETAGRYICHTGPCLYCHSGKCFVNNYLILSLVITGFINIRTAIFLFPFIVTLQWISPFLMEF